MPFMLKVEDRNVRVLAIRNHLPRFFKRFFSLIQKTKARLECLYRCCLVIVLSRQNTLESG